MNDHVTEVGGVARYQAATLGQETGCRSTVPAIFQPVRNPFKKKKQTPQEMERWMTHWVNQRSRGLIWFLLSSVTLFSFSYLFCQWLFLLIKLDFHTGPTFPFWQPVVTGLVSGWINFREGESRYRRYLSELQRPQYLSVNYLNRF